MSPSFGHAYNDHFYDAIELTQLRTYNSKTFKLSDGSFQYIGFADNIHYYKDGKYIDINNSITDCTVENYIYTNYSNSWKVFFKRFVNDDDAICINNGEYSLYSSFPYGNASVAIKSIESDKNWFYDSIQNNNFIVYQNVFENTDLVYSVLSNCLKESLVIYDKDSYLNSYSFSLYSPNLVLIQDVDDKYYFVNSNREIVYELVDMYMIDGAGKRSDNINCYIKEQDGKYTYTIIPDYDFLNSEDTIYPVVLDPSIMITGSNNTYDTCVDEQYPSSNYYLAESLWTGGKTGSNTMRTYIKFSLPTNIQSHNITSAYLHIKKKEHQVPTIKAYRVIDDWTSNTITWNNKPGYSNTNPTGTIVLDSGLWYKLICTDMVKNWINGNYPNYGFLLKEPTESNSSQKTKFYSSDAPSPNKPELIINYTSLEEPDTNPTFIMKHYSDKGYRTRFANCSYSINTYQNVVKNKLEQFFNVNISSNIYNTYESYGDLCKLSMPGQFVNNINSPCGHSPDHLNRTNIKNRFTSDKGNGSATVGKYLWTGHILTGNAKSAAWFSNKVVVISPAGMVNSDYSNKSDLQIKKNSIYTLIHETSHLLSAHDHYCYEDNGVNHCSNNYCIHCNNTSISNYNCIMNTRVYTIESISDVDVMYCSVCKGLIANYIDSLN